MESENVSDYITRVQTVVNQLNRNREMLPETRVVEKILRSLTDNFENVVCTIEESKDLTKFIVDELTGSLEAYEQRKKKKEKPLDQVLQTKATIKDGKVLYSQNFLGRDSRSRRNGRGGQGNGHEKNNQEKRLSSQANWRARGRIQGRGQGYNPNIQCFKCQKYGHYANNCNFEKCYNFGGIEHVAKACRARKRVEETTNLAMEDVIDDSLLLMAQDEDNVNNDTL